jgi:hypothetical protein
MIKIPKRRFIRPGQRHYYRKGTQREIDERRGFVARMVAQGARKMEIHRAVRQKFNVQWRQCDRYLAFVFRTGTGDDTRLTHAHAEHQQKVTNEMLEKLRFIYGDNTK